MEDETTVPDFPIISRPVTPVKRKADLITPDTPCTIRNSGSHSYEHGTLREKRQAVMTSLPVRVDEFPIGLFIEHLLPGVVYQPEDLEHIYEDLRVEGDYKQGSERWSHLRKTGTEEKVFRDFGKLQNRIITIGEKYLNRLPTVDFESNGDRNILSEWEIPHDTRPDGTAFLRNARRPCSQHHWNNTCRADEYKGSNGPWERNDNKEKVIWSIHYLMSEDKARRFAFGLTIEKRTARLYFACRSFVVASEEFDLDSDWKIFVYVTLAFGFATEEQLGWDPTFGITEDGRETIKVKDRTFIIQSVISHFSASSVLGRATRVFSVKDGETGVEYVLKDVWADNLRPREHEIQQNILNDLENDESLPIFKQFLFTHELYWDIEISEDLTDSTLAMTMNHVGTPLDFNECIGQLSLEPPPATKRVVQSRGQISSHTSASSSSSRHSYEASHSRVIARAGFERPCPLHRTHYRLLLRENALPLRSLFDVNKCLTTIGALIQAVDIMAHASWVHRDLSPNNVFYYENGLKLGDFEYAKKYDGSLENKLHDMKTGTRWFWSIEVESEAYLHQPRSNPGTELAPIPNPPPRYVMLTERLIPIPVITKQPSHPFKHNPLHEFESIWWILLYIFTKREVKQHSPKWRRDEQRVQLNRAFPDLPEHNSRRDMMQTSKPLVGLTDTLDPSLGNCYSVLETLRGFLVSAFSRAELPLPSGLDDTAWLNSQLAPTYFSAVQQVAQFTWPEMIDFNENDFSEPEGPEN